MNESLLAAFADCADPATGPDVDEAHVAVLVARLLDPSLDPSATARRLDDLTANLQPGEPPWSCLERLGFTGNREHYESLDNSNLDRVLSTRRGIPITLGVVLIRLARVAGHEAAGINFPGHFLVRVDDTLVDPFVMRSVDEASFRARLPEASRAVPADRLFPPAEPVTVGLRMLNNVKLAFTRAGTWDRLLDVVDAQIALAPDHPALHLEHGDLWRRLGLVAPARTSYRRALSLGRALGGEEAELVSRAARARLDDLGDSGDVLH